MLQKFNGKQKRTKHDAKLTENITSTRITKQKQSKRPYIYIDQSVNNICQF